MAGLQFGVEFKDLNRLKNLLILSGKAGSKFGNIAGPGGSGIQLNGTALMTDRKSTRLNSSHLKLSRMPSSA